VLKFRGAGQGTEALIATPARSQNTPTTSQITLMKWWKRSAGSEIVQSDGVRIAVGTIPPAAPRDQGEL
jgi:hypothetical protein